MPSQASSLTIAPIGALLIAVVLAFSLSVAIRCIIRLSSLPFANILIVFFIKMLAEHIRKTLPEIRVQVKTLIKAREEELAMYGEPVLQDEASQGWQLMNLLARFSQTFSDAIQGNLATLEKSHDPTQLSGGARIRYIFNEGFGRNLAEVNPLGNLTNLEIRTAIRNAQVTPLKQVFSFVSNF